MSENNDKAIAGVTPFIPGRTIFPKSVAALPVVTYQAGETVIADGSRTGRLLILGKGAVAIVKEDTEIAQVAEPGAVFGGLSLLLDKPHTAEVRTLVTSRFHVANATALLCLLAACALIAIAMVHSDNQLASAITMALFASGVAASLLLILAHDRPFIGELSVGPSPLFQVMSGARIQSASDEALIP